MKIAEKIHVFNVFGHISRNVDLTDDIVFVGALACSCFFKSLSSWSEFKRKSDSCSFFCTQVWLTSLFQRVSFEL